MIFAYVSFSNGSRLCVCRRRLSCCHLQQIRRVLRTGSWRRPLGYAIHSTQHVLKCQFRILSLVCCSLLVTLTRDVHENVLRYIWGGSNTDRSDAEKQDMLVLLLVLHVSGPVCTSLQAARSCCRSQKWQMFRLEIWTGTATRASSTIRIWILMFLVLNASPTTDGDERRVCDFLFAIFQLPYLLNMSWNKYVVYSIW